MKLYDIYVNKETKGIIQIESFVTHMDTRDDMFITFSHIERHGEFEIGSCPSFNGYGTKEEIEKDYSKLIDSDDLRNYDDWNEIFDMIK